MDATECTIDTWPGLNSFLEIEGSDESSIREVSKKLGLNYADAKFCEVSFVYGEELGIPKDIILNHTPLITFENPPQKYVG